MEATIKELRTHTKDLLDTVFWGEEITITYRGKPYAKLVPLEFEAPQKEAETHHLFGIWKDRTDLPDVNEYASKIRGR